MQDAYTDVSGRTTQEIKSSDCRDAEKKLTIDCCHAGEGRYPSISLVRSLRMDTGLRRHDESKQLRFSRRLCGDVFWSLISQNHIKIK